MGVLRVEQELGRGHVPVAFAGKDNPIEVVLFDGETEYDYSTARAIRVKFEDTVLDSTVDLDAFDKSEAEIGKLVIRIGGVPLTAKIYNMKVEVEDAEEKLLFFGYVRVVVKDPGM
jgi:hypothetical protein